MIEIDCAQDAAPGRHLAFSPAHDLQQLLVAALLYGGGAEPGDMPLAAGGSVGVGVASVTAGAVGEEDVASVFDRRGRGGGAGGSGWARGRRRSGSTSAEEQQGNEGYEDGGETARP